MAKAVGLFDNVSARDLEALRRRTEERYERDQLAIQALARDEGKAEGMQQVASNMLREKADLSFICKVTGLSQEEINKLKNGS